MAEEFSVHDALSWGLEIPAPTFCDSQTPLTFSSQGPEASEVTCVCTHLTYPFCFSKQAHADWFLNASLLALVLTSMLKCLPDKLCFILTGPKNPFL